MHMKAPQIKGTTGQVVTLLKEPLKDKPSIGNIVIPYIQGLGYSIKKICSKYGIQTHFKGNKTLMQMLVKPKDQDPIDKKVQLATCTSVWNSHVMKSA